MNKKWIAVSLLLLAIAAVLGWQLRESVRQFRRENDLSRISAARGTKRKPAQAKPTPAVDQPKGYDPSEFMVIPENNIFSETRSRQDEAASALPAEPPPLAQKPILVGVMITDAQRRASIIDPGLPQERRRAQIRTIGDVYRGYTITDITPEQIVLESGSRREIIPLHEGSKRSQTGKTAILSTRVVPIGAGSIAANTASSIVSGSAAPVRAGVAPAAGAGVRSSGIQQLGGAIRGVPSAKTPTPTTPPTQQQPPGTGSGPQGSRVIKTPFGDIIRPGN